MAAGPKSSPADTQGRAVPSVFCSEKSPGGRPEIPGVPHQSNAPLLGETLRFPLGGKENGPVCGRKGSEVFMWGPLGELL